MKGAAHSDKVGAGQGVALSYVTIEHFEKDIPILADPGAPGKAWEIKSDPKLSNPTKIELQPRNGF
jgi:hypothetical protein